MPQPQSQPPGAFASVFLPRPHATLSDQHPRGGPAAVGSHHTSVRVLKRALPCAAASACPGLPAFHGLSSGARTIRRMALPSSGSGCDTPLLCGQHTPTPPRGNQGRRSRPAAVAGLGVTSSLSLTPEFRVFLGPVPSDRATWGESVKVESQPHNMLVMPPHLGRRTGKEDSASERV